MCPAGNLLIGPAVCQRVPYINLPFWRLRQTEDTMPEPCALSTQRTEDRNRSIGPDIPLFFPALMGLEREGSVVATNPRNHIEIRLVWPFWTELLRDPLPYLSQLKGPSCQQRGTGRSWMKLKILARGGHVERCHRSAF